MSIRSTIEAIESGRIRIPAFQRGFVWDSERVAYLMDSIYKGYPYGSLLLWRTKHKLKFERRLGPFDLPEPDADYPVDYVLDGQQRLTSIFGTFQTSVVLGEPDAEWLDVYFDLSAPKNAQESQFSALASVEVEPARHFPLRALFDTIEYRRATEGRPDDVVIRIDSMQRRFQEAGIPIQTFETDDRTRVAIVFERVNRLGVELDTLQLLSAWTWSEEFDLQQEFTSLAEQLEPFGFHRLGQDTNLLLRCCAAVVAGDASPNALISLNGAEVRRRFREIVVGIEGAIDFLHINLHVHSLENLPFSTLLVPLTVFFAAPDSRSVKVTNAQREQLVRWFWRASFARRYSSGVLRSLETDIAAMSRLRTGKSDLGDFPTWVGSHFYSLGQFNVNSVNTKTFVLQLASHHPRSFVSGAPVALGDVLRHYNRSEFHHLYPDRYLKSLEIPRWRISALANFAFISAIDNKTLQGDAPSKYRERMVQGQAQQQVLESALCPDELLFSDDYDGFIEARAQWLARDALHLIGAEQPTDDR